jgi:hypothetical protein
MQVNTQTLVPRDPYEDISKVWQEEKGRIEHMIVDETLHDP